MNKTHLIKKYFEQKSFVNSDIESFNYFIEKGMQEILGEVGDIIPTIIPQDVKDFRIKLDKLSVGKPKITEADGSVKKIYPSEARLRKLTYSAPVSVEVSTFIDGVQRETFTSEIGKLPIMVKSKYCYLHNLKSEELIAQGEDPDEPGGYFILNGNERVLITVEDLASNRLFVESTKTGPSKYVGKIFSEKGAYRIPHIIEQMKDGILYLSFTRFSRLPLITVIKALGLIRDDEIMKFVSEDKQYDDVIINLFNSIDLKTQKDAVESVAKRTGIPLEDLERVYDNLDKYLLPHLGTNPEHRIFKAYNLCKLIKKFLIVSKSEIKMDKDHYANKRLKLSGDLLMDLFRVNLRTLVNDLLYNFQRLVKRGKFSSLKIIIRDKLLTSRIKSAMATGSWVGGRKGVSQNIDRTNFLASLSHLQRIVSLLSSSQENFEARALHSTHWGRLCLSKDTNVLLADRYSNRSLEMLQNCWHHHKITTFNVKNNTLKPSAIFDYHTSNPKLTGKKVYKLISESGREIIATEDHPFYTKYGWVDSGKLSVCDDVAVYPSLDPIELPKLPTNELGLTIVDENDIKKNCLNRFKHYIKELKSREILPLTINNYKVEIISRLLGHLFSDGHCGKYNMEFYCGSREDAEKIADDIRLLGFEPSKIKEKVSKIKIRDKEIKYKTYTLTKGGALRALLVLSGAPVGKKTDKKIEIPQWLFKSSLSVKREFLGSLLGGDGPKPRFVVRKKRKSGIKIHLDDIIFHKKKNLKENIIKFSKDIKKLFSDFEVTINKVIIKEDYKRKDGSVMLKCKILFAKSQSNIKNILTKIGYRYCISKEQQSNSIGEWLRIRNRTIKKREELKLKVEKLYKAGVKPKKISSMLNINYRVVQGWLFESYKYKKTRLSQNMLIPYNLWFEKSRLGNSGAVWEKVISKEALDINDVRDFTTIEDTHSFIANGFITHNCPIETPEGTSIGLRKNLAILANVSQEKLSEDKILKLLEGAGLKVNKIG